MSKVLEGQQNQQNSQSGGDWILDEGGKKGGWVLDDGPVEGAPAGSQPQPSPSPAPQPGTAPSPQPQPQPQPQPGQGYQYVTQTGHVFRGPTPEDVTRQMEQALVRMAQTIQQREQEIRSAQTYMGREQDGGRGGRSTDQGRRTDQVSTEHQSRFDKQEFYRSLAEEKPMEAIHMAMQEYFGLDDPRDAFNHTYTIAQKTNDRFETADFLTNNPDFPASPQSAEMLLRRINYDGVPVTRWNLEVAFNQLVREGAMSRVQMQQPPQQPYRQEYQQPQPVPASRGASAPPVPGSSSGGDQLGNRDLTDFEFEQLSTKEQRAYLERKGLI